ncbi:MAG: PDZ domain-containing protein [Planctomycetaceae bacterium]
MIRVLFYSAVSFLLTSLSCSAEQKRALEYTVSFEHRAAHYAEIQMVVPTPATGTIELMMPTWTPGSYLIREYARHVDHLHATSDGKAPLSIQKTSKNRWLVECPIGKDVRITYQLYCHEMSVRTNWVDRDMAVLNGAATFLTVAGAESTPHRIHFDVPEDWSRSMTSLVAVEGRDHTYVAENLDELIDSPVLCGNPVVQDFNAGGVPHVLATIGDSSLWDTAKAAADVQQIVARQQAFWGVVPYSRFKFLNVISETGGGLEHDNSTLVMTSRWNYRNKEKYEDWLSLVSHEFFHTWNVRRLRPVELTQYDYETENNTRSLWVAEGLTSYYEDLMLVRAGLIDQSAYLKRLSKSIEKLQTNPGRNVQSLSESSFDSWIKFYRPDENSSNSRVSYYVKGCVVGFLLDARIRELTNDARSLDDAMRLLYQRHSGPKGYSNSDFAAILSEVAGTDMNAWLAQHVETTDELDYQPALNWLGLRFAESKSEATVAETKAATAPTNEAAREVKPAETDETPNDKREEPRAWIGIQTSDGSASVIITGVTHDSPAHEAGLNVDDEILAFNRYRVNSRTWRDQLTQLGIGETIDVLIARRGEIRTIEVKPVTEPKEKWNLKPVTEPSDEVKARLAKWLSSQ